VRPEAVTGLFNPLSTGGKPSFLEVRAGHGINGRSRIACRQSGDATMIRPFLRARQGAVALLIAVAAVPLMLAAGAAVDIGQAHFAARSLQGVVDAAALAGVAVYTDSTAAAKAAATARTYFEKGVANMPGLNVGAPTITATADATCTGSSSAATVTVSAPVTVKTSLMGLVIPSVTTTISATAKNPIVEFSLNLGGFQAGRDDGDKLALHWYKASASGGAPALSELHKIADNVSYPPSQTYHACIFVNDKIGLALEVWPGGIWPYYTKSEYGHGVGMHFYYYTNIYPPNALAFASGEGHTGNCSLQIAEMTSGSPVPPVIVRGTQGGNTGDCFKTSEPKPYAPIAANGTVSCADLKGGRTVRFEWNDMGPNWTEVYDDLDFNDLELTLGCSQVGETKVILEH
jgi:Flp pilus assembly protein TadG